jgi:predicted nucleic acid-binding protein
VKWTVPEEYSHEARRLIETDHELLAPDIIRLEAANALLKKVRARELGGADAREAIDALPRYLRLVSTFGVYEEALEVAFAFGCTFFDALYVALAIQEGCRLVTGDLRLVRTLPRSLTDQVIQLGDLPDLPDDV